MKILLISYLFPPVGGGGVQRMKALANYLTGHNYQVGVYTEKVNKYKYDVFDNNSNVDPAITVYSGSEIDNNRTLSIKNKRTTNSPNRGRKGLKSFIKEIIKMPFPDAYVKYMLNGIKWGYKTKEKYDVVLGTINPASNAVIAYFYSIFNRVPLIIEYRDLWFGHEFSDMNDNFHIIRNIYELIILKKAKLIVCASPSYADVLIYRHPSIKGKVKVITNGFDNSYIQPIKSFDNNEANRDNLFFSKENDDIVIAHFGRFYGPRKIDQLLISLSKIDNIKFINYGPQISNASINVESYLFFEHRGYVSFNESWAIQKSAETDILILIEYTSDNIPGKIFEYMASGKPVIIVCPKTSVIRKEFKDIDGFYFIENNEISQIEDVINTIMKSEKPKRDLERYSRDYLNSKYISLIHEHV